MAPAAAGVPGVVLALVLVLAACGGPAPPTGGASASGNPATCTVRVTADCTGYTYANPAPGSVVVTAATSSGGNNREFFWAEQGRNEADQTVCATFAAGGGIDQQGVVVRLHMMSGGGISAITVTRNIWAQVFDIFNFHVWNTAEDPSSPFTLFGSTVIPGLPVAPEAYPLNLCVRTVSSRNIVQFVVWSRGQGRPGWGSTTQGGQAVIPAGAPGAGRGGWFAGHLVPGTSMVYTHLSVDGETPTGLP